MLVELGMMPGTTGRRAGGGGRSASRAKSGRRVRSSHSACARECAASRRLLLTGYRGDVCVGQAERRGGRWEGKKIEKMRGWVWDEGRSGVPRMMDREIEVGGSLTLGECRLDSQRQPLSKVNVPQGPRAPERERRRWRRRQRVWHAGKKRQRRHRPWSIFLGGLPPPTRRVACPLVGKKR